MLFGWQLSILDLWRIGSYLSKEKFRLNQGIQRKLHFRSQELLSLSSFRYRKFRSWDTMHKCTYNLYFINNNVGIVISVPSVWKIKKYSQLEMLQLLAVSLKFCLLHFYIPLLWYIFHISLWLCLNMIHIDQNLYPSALPQFQTASRKTEIIPAMTLNITTQATWSAAKRNAKTCLHVQRGCGFLITKDAFSRHLMRWRLIYQRHLLPPRIVCPSIIISVSFWKRLPFIW